MKVLFTPLAESRLELLHGGLNRPHVMSWWGNKLKNLQEVRDKYIPRISGKVPSRSFICNRAATESSSGDSEGTPIGYIQTHWLIEFPDYAEKIGR